LINFSVVGNGPGTKVTIPLEQSIDGMIEAAFG
jgi:hypothetical protein